MDEAKAVAAGYGERAPVNQEVPTESARNGEIPKIQTPLFGTTQHPALSGLVIQTFLNVILSAFFALIFFGSPVVLNEAESRAVFDYFLYIGPAVSAIIAGFGLYVSKGKRIFGIGVDGLFLCVSASFLFLCVVAYAFSKGYLATMLSQSLGVFLLLPLLWILSSLIGKKISIGIVSFLVVFIFAVVFAFAWIYVVSEYKLERPGLIMEAVIKFLFSH
ncbi:hypothetical protein ACDJ03_08610 [Xanthomonas axonopodis pv. nakataecorchori]|uniref:hypothetical protein n=1 Tax=Xanthomonas axonopodis TaxID=53413 RepID=UPI003530E623